MVYQCGSLVRVPLLNFGRPFPRSTDFLCIGSLIEEIVVYTLLPWCRCGRGLPANPVLGKLLRETIADKPG